MSIEYDWYYLFNLDEFVESGLTSTEVTINFPEGEEAILITKGNYYSILFRDVFLSIGLNDKNPFESADGYSVFYDEDGGVWVGVLNED